MSGDHLERLEAALNAPARYITGRVVVVPSDLRDAVAELERLRAERDADDSSAMWLAERNEELRNAVTVAAEMLHRFAAETPCTEGGEICRAHDYARKPCLHALARQFVTAWRAVQAESAPQQPERGGSGCPCGCPVVEGMCSCHEPCPCEPDCGYCLVPNPMREPDAGGEP